MDRKSVFGRDSVTKNVLTMDIPACGPVEGNVAAFRQKHPSGGDEKRAFRPVTKYQKNDKIGN